MESWFNHFINIGDGSQIFFFGMIYTTQTLGLFLIKDDLSDYIISYHKKNIFMEIYV